MRGFKNTRPALFAGPPTRPNSALATVRRIRSRSRNLLLPLHRCITPSPFLFYSLSLPLPRFLIFLIFRSSPLALPPRTCSRSFSLFIPRNQPRLYTRSLATCNRGERVREGPRETCGNRRNNRAMVSRGTSVYPVLLGNNKLRQRWIAVTPIIIRVYFWYLTAPIGIRFFFLSSPATFLSAR